MTTPIPGSWLKKETTTSPTQVGTTDTPSTKKQPKKTFNDSTPSNDSSKKRDPKFDRCVCGHQKRDHTEVVRAQFVFGEQNVEMEHPCFGKDCDCQEFKKKPYVPKEHLTNRPFANNTDMQILKDRLTVHDGTNQANRRNKKGKKR